MSQVHVSQWGQKGELEVRSRDPAKNAGGQRQIQCSLRVLKIPGDRFPQDVHLSRCLNILWSRTRVHPHQEAQSLLLRRSCTRVMKRPWDLAKIQLHIAVNFLLLLAPWLCWQHTQP